MPLLGGPSASLRRILDSRPAILALIVALDFMMNSFLCSFCQERLTMADDIVQPKLVLMSVKLGSRTKALALVSSSSSSGRTSEKLLRRGQSMNELLKREAK